ncbi:hypothetical protein [Sphingomonas sp.]|uniref:hypothetical protein n=1 Tax=Sphingomonas sp. TaxID=28214 RepID=UPI003AFFDBD6
MFLALLLAAAPDAPFPERVPGMIESCIRASIATGEVSEDEVQDSYKYICSDAPAERLWDWLAAAKIPTWTQDVVEGRWLGRAFPLGACFKRTRNPDGTAATDGLSCTIWIPRPGSASSH